MNKFSNFLWGLVLVVIGLILGTNALGLTNINLFFRGWWTLFIIVPCFIGLFKQTGKWASFIGLLIGIFLLLAAQGLVSFDVILKLIVPIVLVGTGLGIMFNGIITSSINKKIKSVDKNGLESYTATFAEQKIDKANEEFKGANLDAVFGGITLNLQKAIISEDRVINASSIFGGITILVPNNVNVKVKSTPIFGGVENKIANNRAENAPTIYVSAFSMFGGVNIK